MTFKMTSEGEQQLGISVWGMLSQEGEDSTWEDTKVSSWHHGSANTCRAAGPDVKGEEMR